MEIEKFMLRADSDIKKSNALFIIGGIHINNDIFK